MIPGFRNYGDNVYDEYLFPPAAKGFHSCNYNDDVDEADYIEFEELDETDFLTDEDYYS